MSEGRGASEAQELAGVQRQSRRQQPFASQQQQQQQQQARQQQAQVPMGSLTQKSIIIHKDDNGFGLRIKGQGQVFVEHVHENGAAWKAGVRAGDRICKVNGAPVGQLTHKDVVLLFKSCGRFAALTLIPSSFASEPDGGAPLLPDATATGGGGGGGLFDSPRRVSHAALPPGAELASVSPSSLISTHLAVRRLSGASASSFGSGSTLGSVFASASASASGSPLMDRTNSCRSPASLLSGASADRFGIGLIRQQQQQQQQQQQRQRLLQAKLSRQDSLEPKTGDKRLAICIHCRSSFEGEPDAQAAPVKQQQQQINPTMTLCGQCQQQQQQSQRAGLELAPQRQAHSSSVRDSDAAPRAAVITSSTIQELRKPPASSASIKSMPDIKDQARAAAATLPDKHARQGAPGGQRQREQQQQQQLQLRQQVNKRIEIIREFIDTERTHTERLRCLDELFYRPLRETGYASSEQLRMVFSSHRSLYKIHKQIYRTLMSANYDVYSEPLVGSALLEIFEGDLKKRLERASCSFCSAQATNTELLNKLTRRDTKAGDLLAQITSQRMVGRLGIKDLLASCFQRLTKYPLLLENLLKATPASLPQDDEDEDEDEYAAPGGAADGVAALTGHRRRSKSGLSAQQRRARLRAGLLHERSSGVDFEPGPGEDEEEEEEEEEDFDGDEFGLETDDEDETAAAAVARASRAAREEEEEEAEAEAEREARRHSRRIMAISLAEEREFIERALAQSRQILVRVNESIRVAIARQRLKEIWKRTDKYPGVPLPNMTKQQVVHEGMLTLRLSSKRSFDVYVLLLNDYIIILNREGQDKYRLKFFTPEGKSAASLVAAAGVGVGGGGGGGNPIGSSNNGPNSLTTSNNIQANPSGGGGAGGPLIAPLQTVYSPVFVIDEHLTTRDAATDENGFYLLCKRKDDSRIYEFASRSPAERMKWRDKIQWTIELKMGRSRRRPSCESTITKSSSEISACAGGRGSASAADSQRSSTGDNAEYRSGTQANAPGASNAANDNVKSEGEQTKPQRAGAGGAGASSRPPTPSAELTKIVGTISYVIDDGIVMPSKMESSRVFVDQAIQVNILDGNTTVTRGSGGGSDQPNLSAQVSAGQ